MALALLQSAASDANAQLRQRQSKEHAHAHSSTGGDDATAEAGWQLALLDRAFAACTLPDCASVLAQLLSEDAENAASLTQRRARLTVRFAAAHVAASKARVATAGAPEAQTSFQKLLEAALMQLQALAGQVCTGAACETELLNFLWHRFLCASVYTHKCVF